MDELLWGVLCEGVERYLAGAERLLSGPAPGARQPSWAAVRAGLLPLLTGWRAVLVDHATTPRGRCRHCDRVRLGRRGTCTVWRTAHAHLVASVPQG